MTLAEFQTLTGITVASGDQTRYTAEIARARRKLETLLGYTLDPNQRLTNYYDELGKTTSDYSCPIVDTDELDPPDAVIHGYRLFNYRTDDPYLAVDPYLTLNKVKLVYIRPGGIPNGVTVKTFDDDYVSSQYLTTWSKYLHEYPRYWYRWACAHSHRLLLAVDADWAFATIPDELNDVWADMVTYYANDSRDLKSESILTHSYTKFDREFPEFTSNSLTVISKYAGSNGTAYKEIVV